jgi:hypothetical protein
LRATCIIYQLLFLVATIVFPSYSFFCCTFSESRYSGYAWLAGRVVPKFLFRGWELDSKASVSTSPASRASSDTGVMSTNDSFRFREKDTREFLGGRAACLHSRKPIRMNWDQSRVLYREFPTLAGIDHLSVIGTDGTDSPLSGKTTQPDNGYYVSASRPPPRIDLYPRTLKFSRPKGSKSRQPKPEGAKEPKTCPITVYIIIQI